MKVQFDRNLRTDKNRQCITRYIKNWADTTEIKGCSSLQTLYRFDSDVLRSAQLFIYRNRYQQALLAFLLSLDNESEMKKKTKNNSITGNHTFRPKEFLFLPSLIFCFWLTHIAPIVKPHEPSLKPKLPKKCNLADAILRINKEVT